MVKAKKAQSKSFKKKKIGTTPKKKYTFKEALRHPIQWFKNLDRKHKILVIAIGVVIVFFLFVGGLFAYYSKDLPDPNKVNSSMAQSSMIYDRDGELLYEVHGDQRRTLIGFDEMPDTIKWATVAIEDVDFYKHHGVDFRGITRAAFNNIFKRRGTQGGSTITQQFVKNAILSPERTYSRKIKEVILAIEIEQKYDKDEILKMYLNEIPYGANAYGIQAAAETYFGKDAKDLKLEECALLAAITKAPTYYSPYGSHTDEMKDRQEIVLDYLAEQGYIEESAATKAKKRKLTFAKYHENIKAPHFVMYVKEVLAQEYGEQMVEEGGLKVTTTLDWDKQEIAQEAVEDGVKRNRGYNASNASLVSIDPKTGQILAMVGSYDYFDLENDGNVNVAIRDRQPGSSFKPYAYASAFKKGFTPETTLFDLNTEFGGGYEPKNYDLAQRGPVQMKNALAMSLNIPAVKTLYLADVDKTIQTAKSMGIGTLNEPDRYGLSLVLGGGEVKLLEHTAAFSTFATNGKKHDKTAILKVEDKEGKVLEEYKDEEGKQVLNENVAKTINDILSTDSLRAPVFGIGSALTLSDRPVAAKTGTTNEYRDAWTMGYTPNISCGVWVGNNDNTEMTSGAAGFTVAAPIWNQYMREAVKKLPKKGFDKPEKMTANKSVLKGKTTDEKGEKIKVCTISGKKATSYCPLAYVKEKSYSLNHCILYYVNKDDPLGDAPTEPKDDPQFERWEGPVSKWAKGKGLGGSAPTSNCNLHKPEYAPNVSITNPSNGDTFYNGSAVTINVSATAPKGMRKVNFYFDGTLLGSDSSSPYSYSGSIPVSVGAGGHTIKAKAYDKYYNENETSISVTVNADSTDPTCTLVTPPNGLGMAVGLFPYSVTANATDAESGMDKVDFYVNGSLLGTDYTPGAGDIYSYIWSYPGAGAYAVYAKAYDRAGNTKDSATSNVNVF
ncbi:penicillin-binding protein [Patescibacteria group bacterium]